ncbi:MAG TPA: glucosyl-3-phosphoglycerate synthase [Acidimicrobiales bacterium]|nr:glucosyl-3-phosphoglycerate synthase [Acidimicrobiales bacterium]
MRTYDHRDFGTEQLVAARRGRKISVCIPARDEERTVGSVVASVRGSLTRSGGGAGLVDEILVVDDGSKDDTASAAGRAGARVVSGSGGPGGKGEAMRLALAVSEGEVLVFLDADVENFSPHFVTGLLGPLLLDGTSVALVKGFYERPLHGEPSGGGRVTELTARPAIDLLFPQLSAVHQPLAGESAAPRAVLEKTGFSPGYGAELGLLVDVAAHFGTGSIVQVDLGVRVHRNRPLSELRRQATEVLRAALDRAEIAIPDD